MPNRILFRVSAVLASLALPVIIPNGARAADDCLTSPDSSMSGGHWRYHLERGTGRKCWYLSGESAKAGAAKADAAQPDADDADVTDSIPPRPATKITPSLERAAAAPPERPRQAKPTPSPSPQPPANNARAEFVDPPQPAPAQPPAPQAAAPATPPQQNAVGTRWPSPGSFAASDNNVPPAAAAPPASPQPSAPAQPSAEAQPAVAVQPAAASVDQAAPAAPADQAIPPPAATRQGPDYLLYALIVAVIGFAAVMGYAGLRFLADWWRDWRVESRWRRAEKSRAAPRGGSMLAMGEVAMGFAPSSEAVTRRARAPQPDPDEPPRSLEDEIDEIEQLLALTREANGQSRASYWEAHPPRDAAE